MESVRRLGAAATSVAQHVVITITTWARHAGAIVVSTLQATTTALTEMQVRDHVVQMPELTRATAATVVLHAASARNPAMQVRRKVVGVLMKVRVPRIAKLQVPRRASVPRDWRLGGLGGAKKTRLLRKIIRVP